jgi:hypothetical protein
MELFPRPLVNSLAGRNYLQVIAKTFPKAQSKTFPNFLMTGPKLRKV